MTRVSATLCCLVVVLGCTASDQDDPRVSTMQEQMDSLASALGRANLALDEREFFVLFRSSPLSFESRAHIATFDALEDGRRNAENCQMVAKIFSEESDGRVRYWCEAGAGPEQITESQQMIRRIRAARIRRDALDPLADYTPGWRSDTLLQSPPSRP